MTEDQEELAEAEMREELFDRLPDEDDGYNPETGERRRVDTNHDWERDA